MNEPALPRLVASGFYGWLRPSRCNLRVWLRAQGDEEAPPSEFGLMLMRSGIEHERRHLERFPRHVDLGELPIDERVDATRAAVEAHERVIYQGTMRAQVELAGDLVEVIGMPDFMLPAREHYAIRDSKLNHRVGGGSHPEIELQLLTYGWLYEQTFGVEPVSLQVHTGLDVIADVEYDGGERALAGLETIHRARRAVTEPAEVVTNAKCSGCGFHYRCWPLAEARRDVGIIAGMDRGLAMELRGCGVRTVGELTERFDAESLGEVERDWGRKRKPVGEVWATRLLAGARAWSEDRPILMKEPEIPEAASYVMFDLEGVPAGPDTGEKIYIWGMHVFGDRPGPFTAGTAGFGPGGDREGWEGFLAKAEAIFTEHGDIPFVHWASYERAKINLYLERYGDRDGVAERVLSNLFDLYPAVRESIAVPKPNYSLKSIELLTGYERRLEEYGGDWSIALYREATASHDPELQAQTMSSILDYNCEDLEATWAVLEWVQATAIRSSQGRGLVG